MSKDTHRSKRKIGYFLFTLPALVLFSILFGVPMLRGFYFSMTDWNGLNRTFNFTGLANYFAMFKDARTVNSFSFTIR